jgi:hypothetical protein
MVYVNVNLQSSAYISLLLDDLLHLIGAIFRVGSSAFVVHLIPLHPSVPSSAHGVLKSYHKLEHNKVYCFLTRSSALPGIYKGTMFRSSNILTIHLTSKQLLFIFYITNFF